MQSFKKNWNGFKKCLSYFTIILFMQFTMLRSFAHASQNDELQNNSLYSIDASGADGKSAQDGTSYKGQRASPEQNGRDGGNATPPTDGINGGKIDLSVNSGDEGTVFFHGSYNQFNRPIININKTEIRFGKTGYINLVTPGGNAQKGGVGGDSEGGGHGRDGVNATRWSSGTNGTDGGDSGDSGAGTSASHPGKGGQVYLKIPRSHLELLMLFKPNVLGGKGAIKGEHGEVGSPGKGGDGGASHHWVTYHTHTTTVNGRTVTHTTTQSHFMPGGSDGRDGRKGKSPTQTLYDTPDAENGEYIIETTDSKGNVQTSNGRYDLQLIDFEIFSHNDDLIIEPGEAVYIKKIRVKNSGHMETPENAAIVLKLSDTKNSITNDIEIKIPKVLKPNEEYEFGDDQYLKFTIKKGILFQIDDSSAKINDSISPESYVQKVNRPFEKFEKKETFTIEYPIIIEPISYITSLEPGQTTRVIIKITNVSSKEYGTASQEIARAIQYELKRNGGTLDIDQLKFYDSKGQEVNIEKGALNSILKLDPKESLIVEGTINVSPNSKLFSNGIISTQLKLENLDKTNEMELIQKSNIQIRVSKAYSLTQGADFLLITNSETDEKQIKAWKDLIENKLNSQFDVWDLSLYGMIELSKQLASNTSLMENYRGKTIIFLTNDFKSSNSSVNPLDLLKKEEFLKAASEYGINFKFIGPNQDLKEFENLLIPTNGAISNEYKSIHEFLRAAEKDNSLTNEFLEVYVNRWSLWGKPKKNYYENKTLKLQNSLEAIHPDRSYIIIQNFEPLLIKKIFFGMFKKWKYGNIQIRRSLDETKGSALMFNVSEETLSNPDFITSNENTLALFLSMGLSQQVNLFKKIVANPTQDKVDVLKILVDAMLVNIAHENAKLSFEKSRNRPSKSTLSNKMNLNELANINFSFTSNTPSWVHKEVFRLAASTKLISSSQKTIWDYIIPFRLNSTLNKLTYSKIEKFINHLYLNLQNHDNSKYSKEQIKLAISKIELELFNQLYVSKDNKVKRKERGKKAYETFMEKGQSIRWTDDTSLLATKKDRLFSKKEIEVLNKVDQGNKLKRESIKDNLQKSRHDLFVENRNAPKENHSTLSVPQTCRALFR